MYERHRMMAAKGQEQQREPTPKLGYLALLIASPVPVVFAFFGRWEMGIGAWLCAGVVVLVAQTHWNFRKSGWFWASLAVSGLLDAPLVWWIPWGDSSLIGIAVVPVLLLSYGMALGCVRLAKRLAYS